MTKSRFVVLRMQPCDHSIKAWPTGQTWRRLIGFWLTYGGPPPPVGPSGPDRERAEALWANRLLHRGLRGSAAWLNEPMGSPTQGRDVEARSAPDPVSATEVRQQKERNQAAIRLMNTWLHEDEAVEPDTWELLKSELDRDRLSARRL